MKTICLYFQMHQPYRLRPYQYFDIGKNHDYFDGSKNQSILEKVNHKSYSPMLDLLALLAKRHPDFRFTLGITGVLLEQWRSHSPEIIAKIRALVATGQVEILGETYYHSLAYLWSLSEWQRQVELHRKTIYGLFGVTPTVFRNTELVFENRLAEAILKLGFKAVLVEGWDHILGWRQPTYVYTSVASPQLRLLAKHYRLSDDIAFRFSERSWAFYPLQIEQYLQWLDEAHGDIINLFMDFETFGEHQWAESGIFIFFEGLIEQLVNNPAYQFLIPSSIIESYQPVDRLDIPYPLSWADTERDLSAWFGNAMQTHLAESLYKLEPVVLASHNLELIHDWRKLQISDHFYYMCTKWFADGDVHQYFNPYSSPYDGYIYYQLAFEDLVWRLKNKVGKHPQIRLNHPC